MNYPRPLPSCTVHEPSFLLLLLLVIVTTHVTFFAVALQSLWLAVLAAAGWGLVKPLLKASQRNGKFACTYCGRRDWPRENTSCPLCAADEPEPEEDEDQ
jgi:hypothetical protein